jgi:sulfoxide reductase heme-binding subunit YedZ
MVPDLTAPARRRHRRRLRHHFLIAVAALAGGAAVAMAYNRHELRSQVSVATAYVGLVCIALSLILGPLNLLRGRPNPVSSDLRRDLGIWGGVVGLIHVAIGLTVHMRGKMHLYFLAPREWHSAVRVRLDLFGAANYSGLFSGAVLLLLVLISSDAALRRLGAARWKRWQRLNYFGAVALACHGVLYQVAEQRTVGLVTFYLVIIATTVCAQGLGVRAVARSR